MHARSGRMKNAAEALLQSVETLLASESQKLLDVARTDAPAFNPLEFFGHREVLLSKVIAWMLDERGTHGQNFSFLKRFVERFSPPDVLNWSDIQACVGTTCAVEVPTPRCIGNEDRRIDILLSGPNLRIAIENKPYAGWQQGQLVSYWTEIRDSRYILITFLGFVNSPQKEVERHWMEDCSNPPAERFPGQKFVRGFGYDQLALWISDCAEIAVPPAVKAFLGSFAKFCEKIATGGLTVTEHESIVETVTNSSETIHSALAIESAMPSVRVALAGRLAEALNEVLPGWDVTAEKAFSEKRIGVKVRASGGSETIDFYLFGSPESSPWVGIPKSLPQSLTGDRHGKGPDGKWLWWRWLDEEDLGPVDVHTVASKTLAARLAKIVLACHKG